MKTLSLLIFFTMGCSAKNIKTISSEKYEFDEIHIFVFSPEVEIYNINRFESPLSLRDRNSFEVHSKESHFVNRFLSQLQLNELQACDKNQVFGYPHILIDAKSGNDKFTLVSDNKIMFTIDKKLCFQVSSLIIKKLNLISE